MMEKNDSSSCDWIGPSEVLKLVMSSGRAMDVAKSFIHQHLCTGEITTVARWLYNDCMMEKENTQVPIYFWQSANILGTEGWTHGDFTTVVKETNTKWKVTGVKFSRKDINNLLDLPKNKSTSASREAVKETKCSLPNLPNRAFMKWWESIENSRNSMSQKVLLDTIRKKYPKHKISRKRIRDLTLGRKRGPKPMCGKVPA